MSDLGPWQMMSDEELRQRRAHPTLAKGHTLEFNTAFTTAHQENPVDEPVFERPEPGPIRPDEPRAVVNDLANQIVTWAHASRERSALAAQIVRAHNPEHRDKTDEEIIGLLVDHAVAKAQAVTRDVYRDREWDRGNDITAWATGEVIVSGNAGGTG